MMIKPLKTWQGSAKLDIGTYETLSKLKIQTHRSIFLKDVSSGETLWINTHTHNSKIKISILKNTKEG